MGAHNFSTVIRGVNRLEEAYRDAVQEALNEHGNDPYNGTISTTHGAVPVHSYPVSLTKAYEIEQEFWTSDTKMDSYGIQKWGPCGAIPLLKETDAPQETRTKKVTLDAVEYAAYSKTHNADLLKEHIKPLKGYEIAEVNVTEGDLTTKVMTKATDGDRETRYIVEGSHRHGTFDTGFTSQAEARAFIDEAAKAEEFTRYGLTQVNKEWGIYAITRRADGSPLVRTKRVVKKAVLTVSYSMKKIPDSKQQDGFLFFGWAAS